MHFGFGNQANVTAKVYDLGDTAHRRVNDFASKDFLKFWGFGGTFFDNDGIGNEIAEAFGVTESRICQIHSQAILSIKAYLAQQEKMDETSHLLAHA